MNRKETIRRAAQEAVTLHGAYVPDREKWLLAATEMLVGAFREGKKVLIAGNGGSAADSQHFAAELVVRLSSKLDRPALPAIALTVDTSIITAASNDYGYQRIFSRQLEALGVAGDVFIGLSTSGKSANIMEAFRAARVKSIKSMGMFGGSGPEDPSLCDLPLLVPSSSTMRIQEQHIFILHLLVELVEGTLYGNDD